MNTHSIPDEPQHTPGPWLVDNETFIKGSWGEHKDTIIAEVYRDYGRALEQVKANARLIAVAPWLLAACELYLEPVSEQDLAAMRLLFPEISLTEVEHSKRAAAARLMREAIAKAKGEST